MNCNGGSKNFPGAKITSRTAAARTVSTQTGPSKCCARADVARTGCSKVFPSGAWPGSRLSPDPRNRDAPEAVFTRRRFPMIVTGVDRAALEAKVKSMYSDVAANPHGEFHFEMGRTMAERLGYSPDDLDRIPEEAIESFAGVGHFFHFADLNHGESVVDLGSGSGMDSFIAAH